MRPEWKGGGLGAREKRLQEEEEKVSGDGVTSYHPYYAGIFPCGRGLNGDRQFNIAAIFFFDLFCLYFRFYRFHFISLVLTLYLRFPNSRWSRPVSVARFGSKSPDQRDLNFDTSPPPPTSL